MNVPRDANYVPVKATLLNTDGRTIIPISISSAHGLRISDGITGSNHGSTDAARDDNNVPVMMGVSSSDFSTPVVIYGDVNGKVMVQSS